MLSYGNWRITCSRSLPFFKRRISYAYLLWASINPSLMLLYYTALCFCRTVSSPCFSSSGLFVSSQIESPSGPLKYTSTSTEPHYDWSPRPCYTCWNTYYLALSFTHTPSVTLPYSNWRPHWTRHSRFISNQWLSRSVFSQLGQTVMRLGSSLRILTATISVWAWIP